MTLGGPGVARQRLARALVGALVASLLVVAPAAAVVAPFTDTVGHQFAEDIEWLRLQDVTNGCGAGRTAPTAR
jgi:hypothetical protein